MSEPVVVYTDGRVHAARRPWGGHWERPVAISPPRSHASGPTLAVDSSGTSTVAWLLPSNRIEAVRARIHGSWTRPTEVAPASELLVDWLMIAANGPGDLMLAWSTQTPANTNGPGNAVHVAIRGHQGPWGEPETVSKTYGWRPQVALARNSDGLVVWTKLARGGPRVQARFRSG
mgnify:CR=1 FL=1